MSMRKSALSVLVIVGQRKLTLLLFWHAIDQSTIISALRIATEHKFFCYDFYSTPKNFDFMKQVFLRARAKLSNVLGKVFLVLLGGFKFENEKLPSL